MVQKIDEETFMAAAERHDHNAYAIAKELGLDHSWTAKRLRRLFPRKVFAGLPSIAPIPGKKRYVVTCAVSGAQVEEDFLASLLRYCDDTQAQLMVVPIRYRNPTSERESPEDWFDPALTPYFFTGRASLHKNLMLLGDIPIIPTAPRPLSGITIMGAGKSIIVPHTKVAFESVPVSPGEHAKIALTTGAVTRADYSHSKAGRKGEFHHVLGAVVVEPDGKLFHVRHLLADHDGGFYDLGGYWSQNKAMRWHETDSVEVLTLGDLHGCRHDADLLDTNIGMIATLRPKHIVVHDVLDFQAASHHNRFFDTMRLHFTGQDDVAAELQKTADMLRKYQKVAELVGAEIIVIDSNHHSHLGQWLQNPNAAHDPVNARIYHDLKARMLNAMSKDGRAPNLLEMALSDYGVKVRFQLDNEPIVFQNVEHGYHGHKGPGGARGSAQNFAGVGIRSTIGHSHSPRIVDGVYQVGTSSQMDMGYNSGSPSAWMHTHCVQYASGKRTLINVVGGKWRKLV